MDNVNKTDNMSSLTRHLGLFSGRILAYIIIIVLFYVGASMAYRFGYSVFREKTVDTAPGKNIEVTITADMSDQELASMLQTKGVIKSDTVFRFQELLYTSKRKPIYPGNYTLNSSWTCEQIFEVITQEPESVEETTALAVSPYPAEES